MQKVMTEERKAQKRLNKQAERARRVAEGMIRLEVWVRQGYVEKVKEAVRRVNEGESWPKVQQPQKWRARA